MVVVLPRTGRLEEWTRRARTVKWREMTHLRWVNGGEVAGEKAVAKTVASVKHLKSFAQTLTQATVWPRKSTDIVDIRGKTSNNQRSAGKKIDFYLNSSALNTIESIGKPFWYTSVIHFESVRTDQRAFFYWRCPLVESNSLHFYFVRQVDHGRAAHRATHRGTQEHTYTDYIRVAVVSRQTIKIIEWSVNLNQIILHLFYLKRLAEKVLQSANTS